jgi:hypothetical protein
MGKRMIAGKPGPEGRSISRANVLNGISVIKRIVARDGFEPSIYGL